MGDDQDLPIGQSPSQQLDELSGELGGLAVGALVLGAALLATLEA
jgi:hypothetical protein